MRTRQHDGRVRVDLDPAREAVAMVDEAIAPAYRSVLDPAVFDLAAHLADGREAFGERSLA